MPQPREENNQLPEEVSEVEVLPQEAKIREIVKTEFRELRIHQGPLPAPSDFEGYERVLPGAAERILQMAEREQIGRLDAHKAMIEKNIHLSATVKLLQQV